MKIPGDVINAEKNYTRILHSCTYVIVKGNMRKEIMTKKKYECTNPLKGRGCHLRVPNPKNCGNVKTVGNERDVGMCIWLKEARVIFYICPNPCNNEPNCAHRSPHKLTGRCKIPYACAGDLPCIPYKPKILKQCPECKNDQEVACPRDVDGKCLECGVELCARHLMQHFVKVHCIDLNWRGFLKS